MILPRTGLLLKECIDILMEGTPTHVNLEALHSGIMRIAGVQAVHDLHVWTITSGRDAMSAHVVIDNNAVADSTLKQVTDMLEHEFNLHHTTVQVEVAQCKNDQENLCAG